MALTKATPTRDAAPPAGGRRRHLSPRWWLVSVVLVGALVFLLVKGIGSSLEYFRTVGQVMKDPAAIGTQDFRLEGTVVRGSVKAIPGGVDFTLSGGGEKVAVHNTGSPPELFAGGIPVVVVGHLTTGANLFVSDQIMVKHSSSYIAAHPGRVKGDPAP